MSFRYTTEYTLGRRGRVSRSYGGIQALIAIAFDLTLGMVFGLVGLSLWLVRRSVVTTYRLTVSLVGLPLRLLRTLSAARPTRQVAKPAWAAFDEL